MKKLILGIGLAMVLVIAFYYGYKKATTFKIYQLPKELSDTKGIGNVINNGDVPLNEVPPIKDAMKIVWDASEAYYIEHQQYPDKIDSLVPADTIQGLKQFGLNYRISSTAQKWEFTITQKAGKIHSYNIGNKGYYPLQLEIVGDSTTILDFGPGYMSSPKKIKIKGEPEVVLNDNYSIQSAKGFASNGEEYATLFLSPYTTEYSKLAELKAKHPLDEMYLVSGVIAMPASITHDPESTVYWVHLHQMNNGAEAENIINTFKNHPVALYYHIRHSPEPDLIVDNNSSLVFKPIIDPNGGKQTALILTLSPNDKNKLTELTNTHKNDFLRIFADDQMLQDIPVGNLNPNGEIELMSAPRESDLAPHSDKLKGKSIKFYFYQP